MKRKAVKTVVRKKNIVITTAHIDVLMFKHGKKKSLFRKYNEENKKGSNCFLTGAYGISY